jgi:hypothetical protein
MNFYTVYNVYNFVFYTICFTHFIRTYNTCFILYRIKRFNPGFYRFTLLTNSAGIGNNYCTYYYNLKLYR